MAKRLTAPRLSDAMLRNMAHITDADIAAGKSLFDSVAPRGYRGLLDAPLKGASSANSRIVWDATAGRYILAGRRVPPLEIRTRVIERLILSAKRTQRTLSAQLQNREITLPEWQSAMINSIKQTQTAAALTANGGEKNTSDSDKEEIAALILALLLLFRKFSQDIQRNRQPLNGLLIVRSDLYASSARGMFEDVSGYNARVYQGKTEERRVLGNADHCRTDGELEGCLELAAKGWQPIGSLPPIGKSPCRSNCKCTKVYR